MMHAAVLSRLRSDEDRCFSSSARWMLHWTCGGSVWQSTRQQPMDVLARQRSSGWKSGAVRPCASGLNEKLSSGAIWPALRRTVSSGCMQRQFGCVTRRSVPDSWRNKRRSSLSSHAALPWPRHS
ncbi:hypothetical protein V5799_025632 [Amblyomma americanum]|uniref:Uncharacterized protein n=1 Tax=Amblyomma americanum TaxID=6943 RepID=A0AAQ4E8R0_AMBAM